MNSITNQRIEWALTRLFLMAGSLLIASRTQAANVPLPEHPRPDFQRASWLNLNGPWRFGFDKEDAGEKRGWTMGKTGFTQSIMVPFSWGAPLSGVDNGADIGWYARTIRIPAAWKGQRVFLVIGACDWHTTVWLDGKLLGKHRGGYTPFEFELTPLAQYDQDQCLVLRVDDTPHPYKLEGKQGYGAARGIWQTVYLEARAPVHLDWLHFIPDIDRATMAVKGQLSDVAPADMPFLLVFKNAGVTLPKQVVRNGEREFQFEVAIPQARWWSLEDPFLYEVEAVLGGTSGEDRVSTYFGMRKISVVNLPGTAFPYIALNNKPVYLEMTLDQSYHPEGFYTYPSDEFMRDEILRSRRIGINANRLHVKIDVPRKLYWADRLGLLLMADVPNSWGEPDADMRAETETALRGMIRRDYNHPAIFSWVIFNETWGLFSKGANGREYTPVTQDWVTSMYRLAKSLDSTRLVEDNSPCNLDHVVTDINSWHSYLAGYQWREHLDQVSRDTFPGSKWNYIGGRTQGNQPLLNSECGNVWGYEGSTGDVDWSWDYHIMMNEFRRHPRICGWLYTEHHDVINEWNGYYRYDRSEKFTGFSDILPGMTLRDMHSPIYLAPGGELCSEVRPGAKVQVPLNLSVMTDHVPQGGLVLRTELSGWDRLGQYRVYRGSSRRVSCGPWMNKVLAPLDIAMPSQPALAVLGLVLTDAAGTVWHRNFVTFLVTDGPSPRDEMTSLNGRKARLLRFAPRSFRAAEWTFKQWDVLDGLKVNGAGSGYFEYRLPWPDGLVVSDISAASLRLEVSAKQLYGKDGAGSVKQEGDFMRGKGTLDPSLNPNAYPMTDTRCFPSAMHVRIAGEAAGVFELPDDPADHRGILSWHAQKRDRRLREAGSYGYLVEASISATALAKAAEAKEIVMRLEVPDSLPGGLAIYGERFGRYPMDPTLVLVLKR